MIYMKHYIGHIDWIFNVVVVVVSQTPLKTNLKEGACSLYHPEILENPAARPGPGHGPATPPTGPGESPDTHFSQGWKYYNGWCSIGIVLHHCQCSNSSSTQKTFHHHETIPAPCSLVFAGPVGV